MIDLKKALYGLAAYALIGLAFVVAAKIAESLSPLEGRR